MQRVTVITAVLNGAAHLDQCIRSVQAQEFPGIDHVIIDGASNDGTLDIIRSHADHLAHWESARDGGIADAMNRGIAQAKGEWLIFLQSDDYLLDPRAILQAMKRCDSGADICGFPVLFGSDVKMKLVQARGANLWLNFKTGFNHQGTLIRRALFERVGHYDTQFKIAMDYEFFLRAYRQGARFARFRSPALAMMRDTGISSQSDWPNLQRRFAEERLAHEKHQLPGMAAAYAAYWFLYPAYRRALAKLREQLPD
jgi:glycosyltransferase involved in cell wall biosynthesis